MHFIAWFIAISSVAVCSDFGGLVTDSGDMIRILILLFLVMLFASVVADLMWNSGEQFNHPRRRDNHFRRIRNQGRAAD
jgi:uncharacterized membrane protein YtjA (UPF0391 family)